MLLESKIKILGHLNPDLRKQIEDPSVARTLVRSTNFCEPALVPKDSPRGYYSQSIQVDK